MENPPHSTPPHLTKNSKAPAKAVVDPLASGPSTVFFVKGIKLFDAEQIIAVCLIAVFFVDDGMPEVNNAGEDDQIPEME
jgi:hypothetical protein